MTPISQLNALPATSRTCGSSGTISAIRFQPYTVGCTRL